MVICTLDEGAEIRMEFTVNTGKGYVPADRNRSEDAPIGLIPVDSLYSPVRKVSYQVENTREGQVLDYDKLTHDDRDQRLGHRRRTRSPSPRASCRTSSTIFVNFDEPQKREIEAPAIRNCRSTRRCSRRSTSSSSRCARPTA